MIVVDVETTGLDPRKHSIVSIGALDFDKPVSIFYRECRIWNGADITEQALRINGFSRVKVTTNENSLELIISRFLKWTDDVKDKTLAGMNPAFDRDFLKQSAEMYGKDWNLGYRTVDLHSICYANYMKSGIKGTLTSDDIFVYVGLTQEPMPHHALTGAKMEAEAFSRMIYGRSLVEDFENIPVPSYLLQS